jgi:trigger factor
MRAEIETNLRREVKQAPAGKVKDQVMEALLKANPIDVPNALLEMEIQRLMQSARQDMEQRGGEDEGFPDAARMVCRSGQAPRQPRV